MLPYVLASVALISIVCIVLAFLGPAAGSFAFCLGRSVVPFAFRILKPSEIVVDGIETLVTIVYGAVCY